MTPAQRAQFQKQLQELKAQLLAKPLARLEPNKRSDDEPADQEDEVPLNEMLQSIASSQNKNTLRTIALIERALVKLREEPEDFGSCEDCGEDIAPGRLKAMPYAEFCIGCQAKQDGPKTGPTRKKITDYK